MLSSDLPSLGSQMQAAGKEEILHGLAGAELHAYKSWLTPRFSDENLILAFHSHSSPLLRTGLSVITHSERDLPSSRHPDPECQARPPHHTPPPPQVACRFREAGTYLCPLAVLGGALGHCGYTPDFKASPVTY